MLCLVTEFGNLSVYLAENYCFSEVVVHMGSVVLNFCNFWEAH